MTEGHRAAPPHGGLVRVAFDGAVGSGRKQLAFQAASVNVDNWSPYWIKLEPVEEYIPPFQHDVTISLPLINSYEFKCLAPPGLDLADIVPPTANAIPGNSFPVICVFSSTPSNNDAGFNALNSAANIATNAVNGTNKVAGINIDPFILQTIDVTNYNGIYFYLFAQGQFDLLFEYDNVNTGAFSGFYQRSFYSHEQMLFTIPKLSKHIRITILNVLPAGSQTNFIWAIRPFLGAGTFAAEQLTDPTNISVISPIWGAPVDVVGNGTVGFPCLGIDNAVISLLPRATAPATETTGFYARVFIIAYGLPFPGARILVATAAWSRGDGLQPKIIPLFGLLQSQAYRVEIDVGNSIGAGVTTSVSFHHAKDATPPTVTQPSPFIFGGTASIAPGAPVLVATIPVFGVLKHFEVTNLTVSATVGALNLMVLGSAASALISIGFIPATVVARHDLLSNSDGFVLYASFNSLWMQTTSALATNVAYLGFVE